MKLKYHYDKDLLEALYRYRTQQYLNAMADDLRRCGMPPVDIQKLTENMKRANTLIGKATAESARGATILDQFEQHLAGYSAHIDGIREYDAQLAAMQQAMGNGGPPLDDTFSGTNVPNSTSAVAPSTLSSTVDLATGDPKR